MKLYMAKISILKQIIAFKEDKSAQIYQFCCEVIKVHVKIRSFMLKFCSIFWAIFWSVNFNLSF